MSNDLNSLLKVLGVKDDDIVTVCLKPIEGTFRGTVGTAADAQERAEQHNGSADVWYGVNPLAQRPATGRGKAADVSRLTALFSDLDIKESGLADMDMVRAVLLDVEGVLGVPASATVGSGNGLHAYWPISDGEDVRRAETALHRFGFLVQRVALEHGGSVDNVYDLARVLRVPATNNVKDPDNPKPVTLTLPADGRALTLDEVERALEAAGVPADATPRDARKRSGTRADFDGGAGEEQRRGGLTDGDPDERLRQACEQVASAKEGERNNTLNVAALRVGHLVPQYLDEEAVTEALVEAAIAAGLPEPEARATIGSGLRAGMADPETLVAPSPLPPTLPTGFWQARESLRRIRQAAWSEAFPADALLGAVLARVSWQTDHRCLLPGARTGTLDLQVTLVGESGDGKGTALDLSSRLVPDVELAPCLCGDPDHDGMYVEVPAGTGEGITGAFYEHVVEKDPDGKTARKHKLDRRHVLIRVDEVEAFTALRDRKGATIVALLRQAFSGEGLGFQYSSAEKRRKVPARDYRLAVVMGVQPTLAAPLFDDVGGGTPQRLLWLSLTDPSLVDLLDGPVPDWPGALIEDDRDRRSDGGLYEFESATWEPDPGFAREADCVMQLAGEVQEEVNGRLIRRRAGQLHVGALDTHRDLLRLKVAGLLARLDGLRTDINVEDWRLAGMVMDTSDGVRQWTLDRIRAEQRQISGKRTEAAVERERAVVADRDAVQRVAYVVARRVIKLGHAKRKDLREAVGQRDREYLDPAIERAVSQCLIVEDDNGGYLPGEARPSEGTG